LNLDAWAVPRELVKTTYLIRVEILADRKIGKDILVRYLVNGLEHSRSGRLGYEVTVYDDFDIVSDLKDASPDMRPGVSR
jgi:hypothetical protein